MAAKPPPRRAAPRQMGDHSSGAGAVIRPPRDEAVRERAVLAAALDPIITIDVTGRVQSASDSVERVLGWTAGELTGRNVSVLMPEPHRSGHDGYLAAYASTGRTNILNRPRRFDARRKDGTLVPIELCVSRADMPGGGPPLFVGIIRDMSKVAAAERSMEQERVRSQQQLAEQTSALQQAHLRLRMADRMASIGTLAAGLGHDMNNVLLPIRARLNALRASGSSGGLARVDCRHVEEIQKSVAYLQQLADGLHFLALDPDAEGGAREGAVGGGATDLRQWWGQTGPLLSKAVPKHVRVIASIPADLPPVALAAHGLTQAVLNLVVNAGEAIPGPAERKRRQGIVRIWAQAAPGGESVRLAVTDNGLGMTDEVQRRAFEMFFTTKPRGLGTGLGLALVRKVAERAGGQVEMSSEPGKGTTVGLVVPAARPIRAAAGVQPGAGRRSGVGIAARITLSDGRVADLVRHLLGSAGVTVAEDSGSPTADVWVVDPVSVHPASARAWRRRCPRGRLVIVGNVGSAAWSVLKPLIIEDAGDFDALRAALARAVAPG